MVVALVNQDMGVHFGVTGDTEVQFVLGQDRQAARSLASSADTVVDMHSSLIASRRAADTTRVMKLKQLTAATASGAHLFVLRFILRLSRCPLRFPL